MKKGLRNSCLDNMDDIDRKATDTAIALAEKLDKLSAPERIRELHEMPLSEQASILNGMSGPLRSEVLITLPLPSISESQGSCVLTSPPLLLYTDASGDEPGSTEQDVERND